MASKSRTAPRAVVSLVARYRSPTAFEFVAEQCHDLSSGGMFIQSPDPVPLGTLLKLECDVDDGQAKIRGVARVVWQREVPSDEGPRGMGVKFVKLEPGSREVIDRLVKKLGGGSIRPEAEEVAQQRRSLAPGARASIPAPAPQVEAPVPHVQAQAPQQPDPRPSAAGSMRPSAPATEAASGREPSQDRPKKPRADAADLRERLERTRRSSEEIDTQQVLAAAAASRASSEAASHTETSAGPSDAGDASAEPQGQASPTKDAFTDAQAIAAGTGAPSAEQARAEGAIEAHEIPEVVVPPVRASNWPKPPSGLAVKLALAVLGVYLVILFSPMLSSKDPDSGKVPTIPDPVAAEVAEVAAPKGAAAAAPTEPLAAPSAGSVAHASAASTASAPEAPTVAPAETAEPVALPATGSDEPSYVVDVITTPAGARVTADGQQRILAPGRLNLGSLQRPVKLLAEKDGYTPTAALVERAGFDLVDGVMRRHIYLKLAPATLEVPREAPPAPAPVGVPEAPAAKAPQPAPKTAPPEPAAAQPTAAQAAKPEAPAAAAKPAASAKAPPPLDAAKQCLAAGDNACVIKALEGRAKSAQELELLIETYRSVGRTSDAERQMEVYVKRFPGERRTATYRRLLERREAEAAAPSAPSDKPAAQPKEPAEPAEPAAEPEKPDAPEQPAAP